MKSCNTWNFVKYFLEKITDDKAACARSMVLTDNDFFFVAFYCEEPVGYLLLSKEISTACSYNIAQLHVNNDTPAEKVIKALLNYTANFARRNRIFRVTAPGNLADSFECVNFIELAKAAGFVENQLASFFMFQVNAENYADYKKLRQLQFYKLISNFEQSRVNVKSFAQSGELYTRFLEKIGVFLSANESPELFSNTTADMRIDDYSFIAHRGSDPLAFCTCTTSDNETLILQQLSVASLQENTKIIALPLIKLVDKVFFENKYKSFIFSSTADALIPCGPLPMRDLLMPFSSALKASALLTLYCTT